MFEYLHHARHFAKSFSLEGNHAPNGQWEHNIAKQQEYLKKMITKLYLVFVLREKIDFIML